MLLNRGAPARGERRTLRDNNSSVVYGQWTVNKQWSMDIIYNYVHLSALKLQEIEENLIFFIHIAQLSMEYGQI